MVAFTNSDTSVTTWTGADIVGSTSVTRDQNGNVNTQRYTPFGEVRTNGNLATDHTYTGQIFDQGTGLGFYNARYYDPVTGRFITPDSIVPNPLDGQDYNRYTYVRNNPIKYSDPSGHDACLGGGGGCGGVRQGDLNGDGFVALDGSSVNERTGLANAPQYVCEICIPEGQTDAFGVAIRLSPEQQAGEIELYRAAALVGPRSPDDISRLTLCIAVCIALASNGTDKVVEFGEFGLGAEFTMGTSSVPLCEKTSSSVGLSVSGPWPVSPVAYGSTGLNGETEVGGGVGVGRPISGGNALTVWESCDGN